MFDTQTYEKVAASLAFPKHLIIDGRDTLASSGQTFVTVNPASGQPLCTVPSCDVADVNRAVSAARRAFEDGRWSRMAPNQRKAILLQLANLLRENALELAVMETLDSGKPICDTVGLDIPDSAHCFQWHAEAADKMEDTVTATDMDTLSLIVREPIGVVAAILPWNFPLQMAAWKLAPILASGNCAVVKPAQLTSLTLMRVCELAREAGLPDGVLNIVTGSGAVLGKALARHPDVQLIAFTGSTEVGKSLLEHAGQTNIKRVLLELGGKNPCVVMPNIADRDTAVRDIVSAALWNMGENCSANSRVLIHEDIAEDMTERIVAEMQAWRVGNPLDPDVRNGPLVSPQHLQGVLQHIQTARHEGALCSMGGTQLFPETGGNYLSPTLFTGVTPAMSLFRDEVFGPVFSITTFRTVEEAITLANDTVYGLHASIWADDMASIHQLSRRVQAGTISVNCYSEGDSGTPFGGFKQSGFFGRDKSLWANRQYTELKTIWMKA